MSAPVDRNLSGVLSEALSWQMAAALRSTACGNTFAPGSAHWGVIASASLWLGTSTHGEKIKPVGVVLAKYSAFIVAITRASGCRHSIVKKPSPRHRGARVRSRLVHADRQARMRRVTAPRG